MDHEADSQAELFTVGVLRLLVARAARMPQLRNNTRHTCVSIALMREREQSVHVSAAISVTSAPQRGWLA